MRSALRSPGCSSRIPATSGSWRPGRPRSRRLAHAAGALAIGDVDPISLGVLAPPAAYGADLACGDIQPLGHPHAVRRGARRLHRHPRRSAGRHGVPVAPVRDCAHGRGRRVRLRRRGLRAHLLRGARGGQGVGGDAAALWGITAGVYLALMGPQGMRELGETIMARTRYAIARLESVPGVRVPFSGATPLQGVRRRSRRHRADGGRRLAGAPRPRHLLRQGSLDRATRPSARRRSCCVTEVHTQADIDRLADDLREVLR